MHGGAIPLRRQALRNSGIQESLAVECHYAAFQLGMSTEFALGADGDRQVKGGHLPAFPHDTGVDRIPVGTVNHHGVNEAS